MNAQEELSRYRERLRLEHPLEWQAGRTRALSEAPYAHDIIEISSSAYQAGWLEARQELNS